MLFCVLVWGEQEKKIKRWVLIGIFSWNYAKLWIFKYFVVCGFFHGDISNYLWMLHIFWTVSHLSSCCTYSFCVHVYLSMHAYIIPMKGIKMERVYDSLPTFLVSDQWQLCLPEIIKICGCLGAWLNSFMLCKLDKGFHDCI